MLFVISEVVQFLSQFSKKKNTKFAALIGFFTLGFLAGSAAPDTTLDYYVYSTAYYVSPNVQSGSYYFERWYSQLGIFFFDHGFSYAQFRLVFGFLCALILYIGVIRFTDNAALVAGLYGVTVFFLDATQIRNFMMIALVILGSSFLINLTKSNVIFAILFIFASAQFQSLGYIFMLIIPLRLIPKEKIINNSGKLIVISMLFYVLLGLIGITKFLSMATNWLTFFGERADFVSKVVEKYNYGSELQLAFLVIVSTTLVFVMSSYFIKNNCGNNKNKEYVLHLISLISLLTLPLLLLAVDYSRIQRDSFLFFLIEISIIVGSPKKQRNSMYVLGIVVTCFMVSITYFYLWGPAYRQSIPYLAQLIR